MIVLLVLSSSRKYRYFQPVSRESAGHRSGGHCDGRGSEKTFGQGETDKKWSRIHQNLAPSDLNEQLDGSTCPG